jgi:hypothetical protein
VTCQPEGEVPFTWRGLMERTAPLEQPSPWNGRDHYAPCLALEALGPERLAWIGIAESDAREQENAEECARHLGRLPGFPLDQLSNSNPPFRGGVGSPTGSVHLSNLSSGHAQPGSDNSPAPVVRRLLRSLVRLAWLRR